MKNDFMTPEMAAYVARHRTGHADSLAQQLRDETARLGETARMQTTPEQGTLLSLLVAATGARRALEIGTFTGMSALHIARGLPDDGKLVCLDSSDEWTNLARRYWDEAGLSHKIELRLGDAHQTLAQCDETFVFVFVDAEKDGYDAYFEAVLPRLQTNGLIVFDNTLMGGGVLDPQNESHRVIAALNAKLADDSRVETVLLPLADGLTLCRKR